MPKVWNGNDSKQENTQPRLTATATAAATAKSTTTAATLLQDSKSDNDDSSQEEVIACCLCHCAVDYADREAFFGQEDNHGSSTTSSSASTSCSATRNSGDKKQPTISNNNSNNNKNETNSHSSNDVLLPVELYDEFNNIVFCDGCDRPYHQKCHFVPLLSIPRDKWFCLICVHRQQEKKKKTKPSFTKKELDKIYPFPPLPTTNEELILKFETQTAALKATLWRRELTSKFFNVLAQQVGQIRHTQFTLESYTSTHRARQFLSKRSQELCQTLVKLYNAKVRIKAHFESLEQIRKGKHEPLENYGILLKWIKEQDTEIQDELREEWFPFGTRRKPRVVPRLKQQEEESNDESTAKHYPDGIPTEVVFNCKSKEKPKEQQSRCAAASKSNTNKKEGKTDKNNNDDEDDDDMISLDDLRCCICFQGDATDENDVLLCDGCHCFRAHHMKCVAPHVSMQEAQDEEEDWFCPICKNIAKYMFDVQAEYMGHEWEEKKMNRQGNGGDGDDGTVKSWTDVNDIFPNAEKDLAVAKRLKRGQRDEETDMLLSRVLGMDIEDLDKSTDVFDSNESNDDLESEEEEDDEDFDLEAFRQKKKQNNNDDSNDDNTSVSSDGTLQDMSSVEIKIGRNELDALSGGSDSGGDTDNSDDDDQSGNKGQKTHRRRRTRANRSSRATGLSTDDDASESSASSKPNVDIGTLDESNIVQGKRNRKKVDYRRLNDAIFGSYGEEEAVELFDDRDDEFRVKKQESSLATSSRTNTSSSNESDDSGECTGRTRRKRKRSPESDEESSSSESQSGKKKGKRKAARRKNRPKTMDESSDEESSSVSPSRPPLRKRARTETKKSPRARRPPKKYGYSSSEEEERGRSARSRRQPKKYGESSSEEEAQDTKRKPATKKLASSGRTRNGFVNHKIDKQSNRHGKPKRK